MPFSHNRVEVLHGVNFDMLGSRNRLIYGDFTLPELEVKIKRFASTSTSSRPSSNRTRRASSSSTFTGSEIADAAIVNAGAWTHYSYAIRDALDSPSLTVEVHLSDISNREEWRRRSVFEDLDLVFGRVYGKGPDGYREALEADRREAGRWG